MVRGPEPQAFPIGQQGRQIAEESLLRAADAGGNVPSALRQQRGLQAVIHLGREQHVGLLRARIDEVEGLSGVRVEGLLESSVQLNHAGLLSFP